MSTPYDAEWLEHDDATRPVEPPPTKERSSASYEREIAGLEKALSDECKNSYRLSRENGQLRRTVDALLPASGCRTVRQALDAFGGPE